MRLHKPYLSFLGMLHPGNGIHLKPETLMKAFDWLYYVFHRFRYPVSLPEEIATDLGVKASNFLTFQEFVSCLTNPSCRPSRLERFMSRDKAEAAFESAQRKEKFGRSSLYSYYFHEGWLEFSLYFDEQARLRRVYLQHKHIPAEQGVEIPLNKYTPHELPESTDQCADYAESTDRMSVV